MARKARKGVSLDTTNQAVSRNSDNTSDVAVVAAILSSNGNVRAAKLNAVAMVFAALVTGSCGVLGVGVQGYFATQQAEISASARKSDLGASQVWPTFDADPTYAAERDQLRALLLAQAVANERSRSEHKSTGSSNGLQNTPERRRLQIVVLNSLEATD